MPVHMDVHNVEGGVAGKDVAAAHEADLAAQGAHGVNYLKYWVDEEAGKIFLPGGGAGRGSSEHCAP
uniref:nickel-binding protein n=1 Tax=Paractinoplanes polyasparticus TaxID=2856853 RepID=UPI0027DF0255|nr:nickel-binding protein [Actinoplanes polyasparticus]